MVIRESEAELIAHYIIQVNIVENLDLSGCRFEKNSFGIICNCFRYNVGLKYCNLSGTEMRSD